MNLQNELADRPIVLFVDDDDTTRMIANEYLSQEGFVVIEACDGLQALELVNEQTPDVVLLDVEMPNLNGYETCARLRLLPKFRIIPILMLTGLDDTRSIDYAFEAGATDFATKPVNWSLLCHRLRYLMRSRDTLDELERSQVSLAAAQRIAGLGNWQWDVQRNAMSWSDQLYRILELDQDVVQPTLCAFLRQVHEDDRTRVDEWIDGAKVSGQVSAIDHRIVMADGNNRHVRQQLEVSTSSDGRVIHLQAAVQDITEQQKSAQKIHKLAYYDGLTSLPNRELFRDRLDQALLLAKRRENTLAVMFLDLDNFKSVNDTLGHSYGDLLLKSVADRLQQCIRSSDSVIRGDLYGDGETIARMGGDEFTVLLPEIVSLEDAKLVANRIFTALAQPHEIEGDKLFTTSSIGIAVYPDNGDTSELLLKQADMAMYFAKREGNGLFKVYDETMNVTSQTRYSMENHLRHAIENNELFLHYQPQMDLATGEINAVEALLRWNNPVIGQVSPMDFIPLAEASGLIVSIGEWVLRTACVQAKSWRDQNLLLERMAVNISTVQIVQPNFPDLVKQILEETGLEANALELEITESVLAKDVSGAISILRRLKEIGLQLSIDDFGTGYSSLSQLKHFPIDRLKIDQSFIRGLMSNAHDAAITKAILAMADSMELVVLAEGVETLEQMCYLQNKHCDEVQGYFISRPLPANEVADLLRMKNNLNDLSA